MSLVATHRIVGCPLAERGQNLHLGYDEKNKDKICYPSRAGIVVRSLVRKHTDSRCSVAS